MTTEDSFSDVIESILRNADIPFVKEMSSGGLRPDFTVFAPDGSRIVIELKSWPKQPGFRNRAIHQARLYQETVDADRALVVVEHLERSRISEGVVTADRLLDALMDIFAGEPLAKAEQYLVDQPESEKTVFAAMPFDGCYDDTFLVAMVPAAKLLGATCLRVDEQPFSGDIVAEIISMISNSIAVIADLSESKPNVLYEAGFAQGLGKSIVHICSTPLDKVPFDVRNQNILAYSLGQTSALRDPLTKQLRAAIKQEA